MELIEFNSIRLKQDQDKTVEKYRRLNTIAQKNAIVLAGSSLMDFFPVNELAQGLGIHETVYNRGVTGFVSSQLLENINTLILDLEPSKLFINIGTNDIGRGLSDELWVNYPKIIRHVKEKLSGSRIYIMGYYPCNNEDDFGLSPAEKEARFRTRTPETLRDANKRLAAMAAELGCRYIEVNDGITDSRGLLKKEFCLDGVHLQADGYIPVLKALAPYFAE